MNVKISWNWIDWESGDTWTKDILPRLLDWGIDETKLKKCVYVIRIKDKFAIQYPEAISPTIYIGEGNLKNRLAGHSKWLDKLKLSVNDFKFTIGVCMPKSKTDINIHKNLEAALLWEFKDKCGCAPLNNRQMEYPKIDYNFKPIETFRSAIFIGRGYRFHWSIKPMPSSHFYKNYLKTH